MIFKIPLLILKTSVETICFGFLIIIFLHFLRKKIGYIVPSFILASILGLLSLIPIYRFNLFAWYEESQMIVKILVSEALGGIDIMLIVSVICVSLLTLAAVVSERLPQQVYRSLFHAVYGFLIGPFL